MVCSSSSLPLRRTMSTAVITMPGVQKPHCRPWFSRNASCIGCNGPSGAASPSMVSTAPPSAWSASVVQDFTAMPLRWTTQAPHCEVSQPTWVPVSRRCSRRNWTRRVRGSTSAVTALPFTVMDTAGMVSSSIPGPTARFSSRIYDPAKQIHTNPSFFDPFPCLEQEQVELGDRVRSRPRAARLARRNAALLLHRRSELGEKVIGKLLGRPVHQPLAELGKLAADLRLDVVTEQRAAVLVGKRHRRTALGEARDAAVALARDLVAVGRVEIGEPHLAFETGFHRADLVGGDRRKLVLAGDVEGFAAGDAGLQDFRIVERSPDLLTARGQLLLSGHRHRHRCISKFRPRSLEFARDVELSPERGSEKGVCA